ncbi:hypothetical protein D9M72_597420 [compost metagenome]
MPTGICATAKARKNDEESAPYPAGDSPKSCCSSGAITARQERKNWLSAKAKVRMAMPRTACVVAARAGRVLEPGGDPGRGVLLGVTASVALYLQRV